jgi:hypothetical protein
MSTSDHEHVRELGNRLAEAQRRGDASALDSLLADDFKLVGPLGLSSTSSSGSSSIARAPSR